jgi:hypothetical protein
MAQINIAEAAANHAVFREKRETPPGATAMYEFMAKNEPDLVGAQLSANVAVLASLNQYLADEISFAFSASRVLSDRGISHVMLVEKDLASKRLEDFDMIVVPYLPLLELAQQEALKRFAEAGGTVLVIGRSGVKNGFNLPNLGNVFLEMLKAESFPAGKMERRCGRGRIVFIPADIPPGRFLIPAKSQSTFTTFGPSMADVFPDIPEGYTRGRIDPALRGILENTADEVLRLLDGRLTRLDSPSPFVEITVMSSPKKDRLLVNLVNYDVTVDGTITPAKNIAVRVLLPAGARIKQIRYSGSLSEMMPVPTRTETKEGRSLVRFTAGEIQVYGLAVLELE